MNIKICFILKLAYALTISACAATGTQQSQSSAPQQGEEKQMATLFFNEQWSSGGPTPNIWTGGTNSPVLHFEDDSHFDHPVMYFQWANGKRGCPNEDPNCSAPTIQTRIDPQILNSGLTIYSTLKFQNFMYSTPGGGQHLPIRVAITGYTGSGSGGTGLEIHRQGHGNITWPSNAQDIYRIFYSRYYWNGTPPNPHDGREFNVCDNTVAPWVEDDVWYEVVWYMRTDNGGSNGRTAIWARPLGSDTWQTQQDYSTQITDVRSTNPLFLLGPYLHNNDSSNPVRMYVGDIRLYAGDAMGDGDLPDAGSGGGDNGGGNGNGGGTEDPLTISNHNVKASDTSATLTWDTNKPSNSIADVGPTEERGTIIRGNDNTTEHVVNIADLTPETQYYYRFSSRTPDGSETVMDQENSTFVTKATDTGGGGNGGGTEPGELALNDLTDVHLASPTEGHALVYNGSTWVNANLDAIVEEKVNAALADLDDRIEAKVVEVLERAKIVVS